LKKDLDARGIFSAIKASNNGNRRGGKPFSRGGLYHLLSNPVFVGEIRHKKERHPGQHEEIITRELWERVQQRLREGTVRRGESSGTEAPRSPLAGRLFDETGDPLLVQGAAKGQRRYRYYVSRKLVHRIALEDGEHGWRLSAPEIERSVSTAVQRMLADHNEIARACEEAGIDAEQLPSVLRLTQGLIERLRADREVTSALAELVERVALSRDGIQVTLRLPLLPTSDHGGVNRGHSGLTGFVPMKMKRRGIELRLVLEGDSVSGRVDLPLLRAVARASRWSDELVSGRARSVDEIAGREDLDRRSVRRLIPLGFLSPKVIEAIVEGRQPPDLTAMRLTRRIDLPLLWNAQEQVLGVR
jgi:hypothetical protein